MGASARDAEAEQQLPLRVIGAVGRLGAAVKGMTGRTRQGVEGRSKTVASVGGGGSGKPVLPEKAVADGEGPAVFSFEIAGWKPEGVAGVGEGGGFAAQGLNKNDPRRRGVRLKTAKYTVTGATTKTAAKAKNPNRRILPGRAPKSAAT